MQHRALGRSGLEVSALCLGMTWGEQNSEVEGHRQMDLAFARGVTFWATAAYVGLARERGLDPVRMATAFVLGRPFVTSAIVGATSLAQLQNQFAAPETTLSPELLAAIERLHARHAYPCP
jgi:aryl-alcohol dehydrogenase-like predicted oxidoreductase